jgi:hypothetical protein
VDVFRIDLNALLKDLSSEASGATIRQNIQAVNADRVALVRAELGFTADTRPDTSSTGHHGAASSSPARGLEEALDALLTVQR